MDSNTIETLQRIEDALRRIEHRQDVQLHVAMVRDTDEFGGYDVRNIKHIRSTPEGLVIDI